MIRAGFDQARMRLAYIWAARDKICPKCNAPVNEACRNLTGIKKFGFDGAKENAYPHTERIDYNKLRNMLYLKGYR